MIAVVIADTGRDIFGETVADLALPGKDSHTTYPTTVGTAGGTVWVTRHNNLSGAGDFQSAAAIAVRPVGTGFTSAATSGSRATGRFTLAGGTTVSLAAVFRTAASGPAGVRSCGCRGC